MRIDFHTHVVPPLPDFAERYGDSRWPTFAVDGSVGRLTRDGVVVRAVPPSTWDSKIRIADMESAGIDRQVLSPLPPLICDWADPEPATEWCARLNDGIADLVARRPGRFLGLGAVPLQHPDRAIAVLRRARDAGLSGAEIGTTAGPRELDHPDLREFFAAAAELGMVLFIHPLILLGAEAGWTPRISGQEVTFGLGMTTDTAIAASKLVFGGVLAEFPDLRICLSHGGGTFAWALPRIARAWDPRHRPAAELTRNLFVDSVVYRPASLRYLCETLGADRVLFGTDYPLPAQDDLRGGVLATLDARDTGRVEGGNAARLLGIDVPAARG